MKKKDYHEPAMEVLELKRQTQLLAGSNEELDLIPMDDPEDLLI